MMSPRSERDYRENAWLRYKNSSRHEKTTILDKFCATCECHRKHAIDDDFCFHKNSITLLYHD
jgi:hypothetical protein